MSEERITQAYEFAKYLKEHGKERRLEFLLNSLEDASRGIVYRKAYEQRLKTAAQMAGVDYHANLMNDTYTLIVWGEDVLCTKILGKEKQNYRVA